jgi:flavin-dependent dehydrogenase
VPGETITFVIGSYRLTCRPCGKTRLVLRAELDACLADAAVAGGAAARYGQPAELVREDGRWVVRVGAERIRAQMILVASGLGGLAGKLGIQGLPQKRRMIAQQWIQPPGPGLPALGSVEMHWLRGGYVGLATPAPEHCVVALGAEAPEPGGQTAWQRLRTLNPAAPVWSVLSEEALRRYGAKGTAGFPWTPQRLGDQNVLLVGDAAGYEEPFSGEGIGLALCSGVCAARAISAGRRAEDVLRHYTLLMRRHHRPATRRLRCLSRVLRSGLIHWLAAGPAVLPRPALANVVNWVHAGA